MNLDTRWVRVGTIDDFPRNGGGCVKVDDKQIAVFRFEMRGEWYACQNMCPHKKDMVLSRGIIGDQHGEPKVACPQHKRNFSLKSGEVFSDEDYRVTIFPVKMENNQIFVGMQDE